MKVRELFENDDLDKFHKSLGNEIKAQAASSAAMHDAMFKNYKWKYEVGDMLLSKKTGKILTITARASQMWKPISDDKGNLYKKGEGPEKKLVPIYRYKAAEESGTLLANLIKPGDYSKVGKD